ncbi:uncharacterized protein LOC102082023 [Oreochromis niloticus]|uniref:Thiaminase I, tandem duplicate 1 n=2 Tax=Oreochromis TaxID=8139 RepID=A0A669DXA1_ORENI|nr:uncharacterized protein LOC102082023 [Oreochromis niloticus]XP_031612051.1 uncharacterized protein LOC116333060 [Oreochromis aureus]XP_039455301.1 uncharacterized protein LOC116333060 [Oreochromis aureus]CAI5685315.1 unnamed protein product [Mustela putorius furo]
MESVKNIDVYEYLWVKNQDIAEHTLHTPFLQHMQLGDLQADNYVKFIIQDINYLVVVTDMLDKMRNKVKVPEDLHSFMEDRYESYKTYAESTLKEFNLNSVSNINSTPVMKKYLSDYKDIMENQDPIYFAVALLPCSRLWLWLANQLNENCCNAYFTWKMSNMYGHPEQHYKALLDKYLTTPKQKELANKLFRQQMKNEHDFFASSLE